MPADDLKKKTGELMPRLRAELEKLVRLPSVAFPDFPEEPVIQAGAAVAALMTAAGLPEVRMVDVARAPQAVFGQRPAQPGAPTVLLYAHYDVQPAGEDSAWTSPPFEPTERAGRLYGRGAADDKSGVVMHAGAVLALGPDCPVGIKVLVEGQEENGQRGMEEFVRANAELLAADVIVIADVGNYALGATGRAGCRVDVAPADTPDAGSRRCSGRSGRSGCRAGCWWRCPCRSEYAWPTDQMEAAIVTGAGRSGGAGDQGQGAHAVPAWPASAS